MRALFSLLLLANLAGFTSAQNPLRCVVCQSLISGRYVWFSDPALAARQPICEACWKSEARCALCRLPVGNQGHKLDDGRWLCSRDFDAGVFSQTEALRVYEEARLDLQGILAGTGELPRANITVSLVDGIQLKKLNQAMPSEHEDHSLLGLTRSRVFSNKQYQHSIYLLSGLGRGRLAAICAHEYTHTWLHENVSSDRALDRDTVEGFCELVAYKLMTQRQEEAEKKVILANAYTRGQVNAFVQAEAAHHFQRIVKWVKTGLDEALPQTDSVADLALRKDEPPPVTWPPPPCLPTPVPDTLTLKGISGGRERKFVLINDCTLTKNEQARVRLGSSNVVVRCVDLRDHSAVIQVKGTPGATELFLGAN